ncbi:uncharacterized protein LOC132697175 isoform X2 [Cylas formicarius]|uniref:uncharacterized protein LOC132697175 isoform X2 n=2 Tax=Cylas formicarius TaxID=197179 RepID=UPI002958BE77|nr:uncharacterized protein LOC132697175 isoform X2 [Cylas formicarius]
MNRPYVISGRTLYPTYVINGVYCTKVLMNRSYKLPSSDKSKGKRITELQSAQNYVSRPKHKKNENNVCKKLFTSPKLMSPEKSGVSSINSTANKVAQECNNLKTSVKTTTEANGSEEIPLVASEENSICEFVRQEEICKGANESPASAVVTNRNLKKADIVNQLKEILIENKNSFDDRLTTLERHISELKSEHQRNYTEIISLIDQLENENEMSFVDKKDCDGNKENSSRKRRSLRLQAKVVNLCESTLKKNLFAKYQTVQVDTPTIDKAMEMFNSTSSICSTLVTPMGQRSLSVKVQEQCLLLQNTPHHN